MTCICFENRSTYQNIKIIITIQFYGYNEERIKHRNKKIHKHP